MEQDVRDAAEALRVAILEAEAAGYKINWPANAAGLATIEISETADVETETTEEREVPEVREAVETIKAKTKAKPTA